MTKLEDPLDDSMAVVKTSTCDTLTKKSRLTYHIGTLPDGEIYFRIHKNTGNGFFSNEWTSGRCFPKCPSASPSPPSC